MGLSTYPSIGRWAKFCQVLLVDFNRRFDVLASRLLTLRFLRLANQGGGSPRRRRHRRASLVAEGLRCLVAERAVGPVAVVVDAPQLDLRAGPRERGEVRLRE